MDLLSLPPFILGALFVVGAIAAGTIPFYVLRGRWSQEVPGHSRELAAQAGLRVSVLYSVLLAMVFADVQSSFNEARKAVQEEAETIVSAIASLEILDTPEAGDLQRSLLNYADSIVAIEWPTLGSNGQYLEVGKLLAQIKLEAFELPHHDGRSTLVRDAVLDAVTDAGRFRRARLVAGIGELPNSFWWVVVFGFAVIYSLFMVFKPTRLNLLIMSGFGAMTGIVLYFIFAMSDPFRGPIQIEPTPFEVLIERASSHIDAKGS